MSALAKLIDRSRAEREDWRYTDVEKLLKNSKPSARPQAAGVPSVFKNTAEAHQFVFVDGVWAKDESQTGVLLEGDLASGYRLSLAAQSCLVTAPIELVFVGEKETEVELKLSVTVGDNASVAILEHHLSNNPAAGSHIIETDIRLGEQSKLIHEKIVHGTRDVAHFARSRINVAGGAFYNNFILVKNTRLLRNEVDVTLAGSLAQCSLNGALLLRDREHVDILTRVRHNASHGTSRQLFKAILKDQARGVFQGKIAVAEGAQKTDGKQLCRALLLSDQAEMDAKPELEIYADDVACSHGCAVGDIDREAMFYLRSRGLSEHEARALLLRAFVDEAIDEIQLDQVRAAVHGWSEGWMNEQA